MREVAAVAGQIRGGRAGQRWPRYEEQVDHEGERRLRCRCSRASQCDVQCRALDGDERSTERGLRQGADEGPATIGDQGTPLSIGQGNVARSGVKGIETVARPAAELDGYTTDGARHDGPLTLGVARDIDASPER